jgi:hypothetical protein
MKDPFKNTGNWQKKLLLHCLSFTLSSNIIYYFLSLAADGFIFLLTVDHFYCI